MQDEGVSTRDTLRAHKNPRLSNIGGSNENAQDSWVRKLASMYDDNVMYSLAGCTSILSAIAAPMPVRISLFRLFGHTKIKWVRSAICSRYCPAHQLPRLGHQIIYQFWKPLFFCEHMHIYIQKGCHMVCSASTGTIKETRFGSHKNRLIIQRVVFNWAVLIDEQMSKRCPIPYQMTSKGLQQGWGRFTPTR